MLALYQISIMKVSHLWILLILAHRPIPVYVYWLNLNWWHRCQRHLVDPVVSFDPILKAFDAIPWCVVPTFQFVYQSLYLCNLILMDQRTQCLTNERKCPDMKIMGNYSVKEMRNWTCSSILLVIKWETCTFQNQLTNNCHYIVYQRRPHFDLSKKNIGNTLWTFKACIEFTITVNYMIHFDCRVKFNWWLCFDSISNSCDSMTKFTFEEREMPTVTQSRFEIVLLLILPLKFDIQQEKKRWNKTTAPTINCSQILEIERINIEWCLKVFVWNTARFRRRVFAEFYSNWTIFCLPSDVEQTWLFQ